MEVHGFLFIFFFLHLYAFRDVFVPGRNQPSPQAGPAGPGPAGYGAARPVGSTQRGSQEV